MVTLPVPLIKQFQPSSVYSTVTAAFWTITHGDSWSASRRSQLQSCHQTRRTFLVPLVALPPLHGLKRWGSDLVHGSSGTRIKMCLTGCCCMFISHFSVLLQLWGSPRPCAFSAAVSDTKHKSELGMGPCSAELQGRGIWTVLWPRQLNIYLRAKLSNLLFSSSQRRREEGIEPMMIFLSMLPGNSCLTQNMRCTWCPAVHRCSFMFPFIFLHI